MSLMLPAYLADDVKPGARRLGPSVPPRYEEPDCSAWPSSDPMFERPESAILLTGQREQSHRHRSQVRLASSNLATSRTTSWLQ
jgi:hypothetical protein